MLFCHHHVQHATILNLAPGSVQQPLRSWRPVRLRPGRGFARDRILVVSAGRVCCAHRLVIPAEAGIQTPVSIAERNEKRRKKESGDAENRPKAGKLEARNPRQTRVSSPRWGKQTWVLCFEPWDFGTRICFEIRHSDFGFARFAASDWGTLPCFHAAPGRLLHTSDLTLAGPGPGLLFLAVAAFIAL